MIKPLFVYMIRDTEKVYDISRRLSYKFTDDENYVEHEIKNAGPRTLMFALVPVKVFPLMLFLS